MGGAGQNCLFDRRDWEMTLNRNQQNYSHFCYFHHHTHKSLAHACPFVVCYLQTGQVSCFIFFICLALKRIFLIISQRWISLRNCKTLFFLHFSEEKKKRWVKHPYFQFHMEVVATQIAKGPHGPGPEVLSMVDKMDTVM